MKKNYINFSIIVSNTQRSIEYLRQLRINNLIPNYIIHLDNKKKYYEKYFKDFSSTNNSKYKRFVSETIDSAYVKKKILELDDKILVYSGYPGKIIRTIEILKKKFLLHSHPGKLPNFRGSTVMFYSLILQKQIYCSTIVLSPFLDRGKIILKKKYEIPKKISQINGSFDDKIRALNMAQSLIKFKLNNFNKIRNNDKKLYVDYTVAHTLLRSLALKIKK